MKKPKNFTLFVPIYEYYIWVQLGGDSTSFFKFASDKLNCTVSNSHWLSGAVVYLSDVPDHCLWFRDIDPDASTIAHELFHSVCHVFRHKGIWPLTAENEESFAYLIGSLTRQVVLQIKKVKHKKK